MASAALSPLRSKSALADWSFPRIPDFPFVTAVGVPSKRLPEHGLPRRLRLLVMTSVDGDSEDRSVIARSRRRRGDLRLLAVLLARGPNATYLLRC